MHNDTLVDVSKLARQPNSTFADPIRAEESLVEQEIIQSSLRIIKDVHTDLSQFCKSKGITIDTLLEAAFSELKRNPSLMESVLKNAKSRYQERKRVGKLRKMRTMQRNLSQS